MSLSMIIVVFLCKLALVSCRRPCAFCIQQQNSPFDEESAHRRQICFIDDEFQNDSQTIASSLSIPVSSQLSNCVEGFSHALRLVPFESGDISTYALAIESLLDSGDKSKRRKPKQKRVSNPFYVDLCSPKSSRMGKHGARETGTDLLVKAVAPKRSASDGQDGAIVYDLTAGFGQDSLVLALNGASKVYMVERDPIVAALLEDALRRVNLVSSSQTSKSSQNELACFLSERLRLKVGDAKEIVKCMAESKDVPQADVVYLDPMFPPRTKSAAVKKGMQILHGLLDTQQPDEESLNERILEEKRLLEAALQIARVRVVVKRPVRALPLGGEGSMAPWPSYAVQGSTNRWDVYINNEQSPN